MKPTPTPCHTPRHDWIQAQLAQRGATRYIPLPTSADFTHIALLPGQLSFTDPLMDSVFLIPTGYLKGRMLLPFEYSLKLWFITRLSRLLAYPIADALILIAGSCSTLFLSDNLFFNPSEIASNRYIPVSSKWHELVAYVAMKRGLLSRGQFRAAFQGICCTSGVLRASENLRVISWSVVSGGLVGEGVDRGNLNSAAGNGICLVVTLALTPLSCPLFTVSRH